MTTSTQQAAQNYNSVSAPWQPTQPLLTNITNSLGGVSTVPEPTQNQNLALNSLYGAASATPNFGPTVANVAGSYLAGQPNAPVAQAAGAASNALSPYLSSSYLNPYNNPAEQQLSNQIISQVNGTFAGAGRDLSPANSQAAVAGLAPTLFGQYNANAGQQQNAANSLFNIANTANQSYLQNAGFGVNTANAVPGAYLAPGTSQLSAANLAYGTPLQNVAGLENLILPIAGLGGQTSGTQNTQTSYTPSPLQSAGYFFGGGSNSPFTGLTGAAQGFGNSLYGAFNPTNPLNQTGSLY